MDVAVSCSIMNGVELRLFEHEFDDGTGCRAHHFPSHSVHLHGPSGHGGGVNSPGTGEPVVTMVDAELWRRWLEKNRETDLVLSGAIQGPSEEPQALSEEPEDRMVPRNAPLTRPPQAPTAQQDPTERTADALAPPSWG